MSEKVKIPEFYFEEECDDWKADPMAKELRRLMRVYINDGDYNLHHFIKHLVLLGISLGKDVVMLSDEQLLLYCAKVIYGEQAEFKDITVTVEEVEEDAAKLH